MALHLFWRTPVGLDGTVASKLGLLRLNTKQNTVILQLQHKVPFKISEPISVNTENRQSSQILSSVSQHRTRL